MKHIALERIRQFQNNENVFPIENLEPKDITLGEIMEVETYGLVQKGRVLGIRPSQLGGIKVMCIKI